MKHIPHQLLHYLLEKFCVMVEARIAGLVFSRSVMSDSLLSHDCSMPGFPVTHQLLELTQTHVHRVGDAIQPSHPLSSHSHPAFNLSQHHGLFQRVGSLHQLKVFWPGA